MSGAAVIHPLHDAQMAAVAPEETVWLSASAGTGKTHVLASRVLRLLMQPGVHPSQILCLTFTKAGAAEMAARIHRDLAAWVRLPEDQLFLHLEAIGAPADARARDRARTLFAAVLDCPGGGLRIDTIHAFSQWLLAAFPEEAQLAPGTRAMEDRDRTLLLRQVLADLLVRAESEPLGDPQLLSAMADLSLRQGADAVETYLLRCAAARPLWIGPGSWQEPLRPRVNQLLGLPADAGMDLAHAACADDAFDIASLRAMLEANNAWGTRTGIKAVEAIGDWLVATPEQRVEDLPALTGALFTKEGKPRSEASLVKLDPDFPDHAGRVAAAIACAHAIATLVGLAERLVPALRLGRAFALAWDEAKRREGLIDFDDQIRLVADLLTGSRYADWIGYKLDRRFDHILVDEAQDTNAAQWAIIGALTQDFFAGQGAHADVVRTLFVVGDTKQAIFRFQGTSPQNFTAAGKRVRAQMDAAVANARGQRSRERPRSFQDLELRHSFRTAQRVLDFVDGAIATIGHTGFGLGTPPERHVGERRPGYVALWRPIGEDVAAAGDAATEQHDAAVEMEAEPAAEDAATWLSKPDRLLADRIALQVRRWMDEGFTLVKGRKPGEPPLRARPQDVMVLVRKRRDLAALIVARLHAAGVRVAGVDRLRLAAPLAVRDLMAALRFAAQPLDCLNLACLLTSPLVGWSQEQLLEHGYRPDYVRLWSHLRAGTHPDVIAAVGRLSELLRLADFQPPAALLHWLLVGPWQARRRLLARLGRESGDPIDELVNAARAYAGAATPSLIGFIAWFDAGQGELKREPDGVGDAVRVLTVHGAKGLQAPIVILADAAGDPGNGRGPALDVPDAHGDARIVPLPPVAKAERVGRIGEAYDRIVREELEEHWRLLYVAMTRAEEALFVTGALDPRHKEAPADSWFARLRQQFGAGDWVADPLWRDRLDWGEPPEPLGAQPALPAGSLPPSEPLPRWLHRPPAAEPRPPRPLAPSSLGEEDAAADPVRPEGSGRIAARERGVLAHKLLERLPAVPPAERRAVAARWLERHAGAAIDATAREALLAGVLTVIADARWAELFGPDALAEVPVAGLAGDRVIAGTIDRLLVTPDRIRLVDFKTSGRAPTRVEDVPDAVVRQMAAYALALAGAFPGRTIEAALLYTAGPHLLTLPPDLVDRHKRALIAAQQS